MRAVDGVPAELVALRRVAEPFFADEYELGDYAFELDAEPAGVVSYTAAPDGAAHRRFFRDVLWFGAGIDGSLLGYWKGDAATFDAAPVIRIDNEGRCTVEAASIVDYLGELLGAEHPQVLGLCAAAGLAPPRDEAGRAAAIAGRDDPGKLWDALGAAERVRAAEEVPPRPLSSSPLAVRTPAGILVVSQSDDIRRNTGDNVTFLLDVDELTCTLPRPVPSGTTYVHGVVRGLPAFVMFGARSLARHLVTLEVNGFWKPGPPSPEGLCGGAAAVLRDGRVLFAGGFATARSTQATVRCELLDPATGTWTATGDLADERHRPVLVPAGDGALVVADQINGWTLSDRCERYDPATGTWRAAAALPFPIDVRDAVALTDGSVLALGRQGWAVYEPATDRWTHAGALLSDEVTAAQYDDTHVALFDMTTTVRVLDLATGALTEAGRTRLPRGDSTAAALPGGAVLLLGGEFATNVAKEPEIWSPSGGRALPGLSAQLDRQAG